MNRSARRALIVFAAALLPASLAPRHLGAAPQKSLPLQGEVFLVQGRTAFVIPPQVKPANRPVPWVWYAPTLPGLPGDAEKWMFERFTQAGIAIAGIDVGESYGSPGGRSLYTAFYRELAERRGFAPKAVMLGRSRGGLMALSWAAENADKVAAFAGIYPVCNVASYPGLEQASGAYGMTAAELSLHLMEHNPLDRLAALAKTGVPLFAIHGDRDKVVPLEANSGEMRKRYEALGGKMQLVIPPGQGHNMWAGFFQCQELVDFVIARSTTELAWPEIRRPETRPWTWWWWHGCAVTKADITANLEALHKSGMGGVNIVCLLDVRDDQAQRLGYLSPQWLEAVTHAVREARRLGMDADMSPVPGWAFGGPWVPREESCATVEVRQWKAAATSIPAGGLTRRQEGWPLSASDLKTLDALVFVSADGRSINLTKKPDAAGASDPTIARGAGTYYAVLTRRGSSAVRMPTPDGRGPVVDHLSVAAVRNYLGRFDKAFAGVAASDLPRAYNNDSWEINLNWTPGLLDEFEKRRGYDLRQHLPAFMGQAAEDLVARVACDYRHTVSDLMVDRFTETFRGWAADHGGRIIGEAQDEPGNELDINALYDIPQADLGGPRNWFIRDGDYATDHFFRRCKIPASPAHILGRPLVSSETFTCMGPILDTPLEMAKEKIDYDLVAGVNHTMFHGIAYSPAHARWPGWLFYAGTHLGPFNPMWRQGRQLCDYVARCQSFLQTGRPDADVLVYYPVFDLWSQRRPGRPSPPGVVRMDKPGPAAAARLWRAGVDFDFVSDRLLESLRVVDGRLAAAGTSYRALVVSECRLMPVETLERIEKWIGDGATVVLHGPLPADVPGLGRLDERRARFRAVMARIEAARSADRESGIARLGKGRIIFGDNILAAMDHSAIHRETMADSGLRFIRRRDERGTIHFIANPAQNKRVDGWVPLASSGETAAIFDPLSGRFGVAEFRKSGQSGCSVRLQLDPRESCIVRVFKEAIIGPAWPYFAPAGPATIIPGPWEVRFLEGGEAIPHPESVAQLASWTNWKSDQAATLRAFAGVACYTSRFPTPQAKADAWAVDLGEVCHTARVRLNGQVLGDLISRPMRVVAASLVKEGQNVLEIEVANAPINRAADLDIHGIPWLKTLGEDARTFVIGDFLFPWKKKDSKWIPRPSGLLGPVQLVPLARSGA